MIDADLPIPYVPSTPVITDVLEQAATEFDQQQRDGWHLIAVTFTEIIDGEVVERDALYLETNDD